MVREVARNGYADAAGSTAVRDDPVVAVLSALHSLDNLDFCGTTAYDALRQEPATIADFKASLGVLDQAQSVLTAAATPGIRVTPDEVRNIGEYLAGKPQLLGGLPSVFQAIDMAQQVKEGNPHVDVYVDAERIGRVADFRDALAGLERASSATAPARVTESPPQVAAEAPQAAMALVP